MLNNISHSELINIIDKYIKKSDFYKNKYKHVDVSQLHNIPFLTKRELLEDQEINPPYGSNLCCENIKRVHRTSGTTNKPLLIALSERDLDIVTDVGSDLFKLTGMNANDTVINCLNYNMWMGGFTDHVSMEKTGATVIPFGVGHTDNLIELIKSLHGCSLHCTPSYLKVINKKLENHDLKPKDLKLEKGFLGAEGGLQNKSFRAKIENLWGIEAINANYGISEVISMLGAECKERVGLHFGAEDFLYVEMVDENLNVLEIDDGVEGELVVTHLQKEAQPLIRYRTGDIIKIISLDKCVCGGKGFRFKIAGRVDDMLVVKGVNFFPESIRDIVNKYKECNGIYKVIATKQEPIEKIKVVIGVVNESDLVSLSLKDSLSKNIKEKLNVSADIELTDEVEFTGNKFKIIERV